jgi:hypothetical protein
MSQTCIELRMADNEPGQPRTFDIEGQLVRCFEANGHRLWRCECADFQRRLAQFGNGFCAHTALPIQRCIEDGSIKL